MYNTVALLTLSYGCENWTTKAKYKSRIMAAQIRLRQEVKHTWTD